VYLYLGGLDGEISERVYKGLLVYIPKVKSGYCPFQVIESSMAKTQIKLSALEADFELRPEKVFSQGDLISVSTPAVASIGICPVV
jgi:hypothetical protein